MPETFQYGNEQTVFSQLALQAMYNFVLNLSDKATSCSWFSATSVCNSSCIQQKLSVRALRSCFIPYHSCCC